MKLRTCFCACLLVSSAAGASWPVWAQPVGEMPQQRISALPAVFLRDATEAAWQRAIPMQEASAQARRARADQISAGSWSPLPPAVEVGQLNDRAGGAGSGRETEVALAVPLWLPGQRQARGDAADAELALAEAAAATGKLRIAGQVRELAWRLVMLDAELSVAWRQREYLGRLADDVDRRVQAGDLARTDALAARAELLEARSIVSEVEQRLSASRSQWVTLTGLDRMPQLSASTFDIADSTVLSEHPELRLATQAVDRAQKRIEVVDRSRRDPPEVRVRYRDESGQLSGASQRGIGVAIRIPFGTAGRNAPLEAAALGDLDIADTQLLRLRERLNADVEVAKAGLRRAREQLQGARTRAELQQERGRLVDASFKAGETSLPELLRVINAATQAEAALARQQAAVGLASAQLDQALGLLP